MPRRGRGRASVTSLSASEDFQESYRGYQEREKRRRFAASKPPSTKVDESVSNNNITAVAMVILVLFMGVLGLRLIFVKN